MKIAADQRTQAFRLTAAECAAHLPSPAGERFHVALSRGQLQVELYQPLRHDPQKPHDRDEIYFVVAGSGSFIMADERVAFAAGDCLFVPAGMTHRFEDFGESLTVWVVFYGDIGGDSTLQSDDGPEPSAPRALSVSNNSDLPADLVLGPKKD